MEKIELPSQFRKPKGDRDASKGQLLFSQFEQEIEKLPNYEEPGSFYRGMSVNDVLLSLFGRLKLEANPDDLIGERDNATINANNAIKYGRTSETKEGKKFICAIGFDLLPGAKVEPSRLGRWNQYKINGLVIAKEIFVRFAGKKPGKPSMIQTFSPRDFYIWCKENVRL